MLQVRSRAAARNAARPSIARRYDSAPNPQITPLATAEMRRVVAKVLAREDVRQMHLDDRRVDGADRVVQRDRGMRVGAGVQHHAGRVGRLVQPVD